MNSSRVRLGVLAVATAATIVSLSATTQTFAQQRSTQQTARYAAIKKCSQQARAQTARIYGADEAGKARTLVYASCMRQLGFAP
jgi:hypothetical protein